MVSQKFAVEHLCNTLPATDAEGSQPPLRITPSHFVEKIDEDAAGKRVGEMLLSRAA